MLKLQKLIEITDELTEQIVLDINPDADIYRDDGKELRMKKRYCGIRGRIFTILESNLKGVK